MARAQPAPATPPPLDPTDAVEAYIENLGMTRLLAEQLAMRLSGAPREERLVIAERLGKMYVLLLSGATNVDEQRMWEQRGRDLLRDVPESDTWDLRLNLNKAVYIRAEEVAERGRLRLAEATELKEAEQKLRNLEPQFTDIAGKAHRRVDQLERLENAGDATEALAAELSEARRIRSLAFYYAGWCHCYTGMLSGTQVGALEALKCFGWLLNSPNNRPASPDRAPVALMRYDHIARAAIGSALACSQRGQDGDATRWLDVVESAEGISDVVRDQLVVRRIGVLGEARRWADLDFFLRKVRSADRTGGGPNVKPLAAVPARLLAVIVLEADKRIARDQVEGLARVALGDLVARNEVRQVLDLVRRYGTAPMGETGFIVNYVRGLMQYDQARAAHKALDPAAEEPTTDPAAANLYRAAAAMLLAAIQQPDAESFRAERADAALTLGRSEFFAGDIAVAGERFAMAFELAGGAGGGASAEEALWLSVVAVDKAARLGGPASARASERRTEVASLFLRAFPDSPRAARVVLLQAAIGEVGDEEALRILSEVPRDSPVYEAARRQVARLLYVKMRSAVGSDRDFAALRFIGVSEELLAIDRRAALSQNAVEARAAGERLLVRVRQMLDALLGGASPDAGRAAAVLDVLSDVARVSTLDLSEHEPELTFRRIQIALGRAQEAEAVGLVHRLAAMGPRAAQYVAAADRLVYRRIAARWRTSPTDADARTLVRVGQRIIQTLAGDPGERNDAALADPAVAGVFSTVAAAATSLAHGEDTAPMRRLAIELDSTLLRAQPRLEEPLRRLAANAEAAGDLPTAIECWSTVLAASVQATPTWFEARYNTLRLLAEVDPARARALLDQHRLLFPDFGPAPWGAQLRALHERTHSAPPGPAEPRAPSPENDGGPS